MEPNQANSAAAQEEPPAPTPTPPQAPNTKKLVVIIGVIVGALLLLLIALLLVLLVQQSNGGKSKPNDNSKQSSNTTQSSNTNRKVAKTIVLEKNPSLQVTVYEPRQTGTNTMIDYSIKNICTSSCSENEYVDSYNLGVINESSAYLLDAESGTKFNPITDSNNKPLASDPCAGFIAPGKAVDCFAAFTKVPDGATFSFVLRGLKVDGLTAQ